MRLNLLIVIRRRSRIVLHEISRPTNTRTDASAAQLPVRPPSFLFHSADLVDHSLGQEAHLPTLALS